MLQFYPQKGVMLLMGGATFCFLVRTLQVKGLWIGLEGCLKCLCCGLGFLLPLYWVVRLFSLSLWVLIAYLVFISIVSLKYYPKKKKNLTCRSRYHMQPQLQWHKIINMMGLQDAMTLTRKLIISWRKKQTSQWTNLPLLSFHFYEHQLVQMLLNLKFHTSQCSLQNCATYTCRVVNQQIN